VPQSPGLVNEGGVSLEKASCVLMPSNHDAGIGEGESQDGGGWAAQLQPTFSSSAPATLTGVAQRNQSRKLTHAMHTIALHRVTRTNIWVSDNALRPKSRGPHAGRWFSPVGPRPSNQPRFRPSMMHPAIHFAAGFAGHDGRLADVRSARRRASFQRGAAAAWLLNGGGPRWVPMALSQACAWFAGGLSFVLGNRVDGAIGM
jgi:hypothetical protein